MAVTMNRSPPIACVLGDCVVFGTWMGCAFLVGCNTASAVLEVYLNPPPAGGFSSSRISLGLGENFPFLL
jgi:hypothetical protein